MGFSSFRDYAEDASDRGQYWMSFMYKTGTPVLPAAGRWGDVSMSAGTPKYNAYVGSQGEATPLYGSGNNGIYAGESVAPLTKHLSRILLQTNGATFAPAKFVLCDYLMFYPLTDMDSTDLQEFVQAATLPRYANGKGVQVMLVSTVPQTANATCTISYTNQDGTPGRTSTFTILGPSNVGNLLTSGSTAAGGSNPFIPLQSGDYGVRSVESIQLAASAGGFCSIVLVQTISSFLIRETNTATEHFYLKHKPSLPQVQDGAHLNFIFSSGVAAASSILRGELEFYWG